MVDLCAAALLHSPICQPHGIGDLRSASGTGARHFFTLRDDSWPDSMAAGLRTIAPDSPPGAIAEPVRASPGPTKAPQTLAFGGLTTGSPQTKRDYAAHGGTVDIMALLAY
jgi:hypothetical protein